MPSHGTKPPPPPTEAEIAESIAKAKAAAAGADVVIAVLGETAMHEQRIRLARHPWNCPAFSSRCSKPSPRPASRLCWCLRTAARSIIRWAVAACSGDPRSVVSRHRRRQRRGRCALRRCESRRQTAHQLGARPPARSRSTTTTTSPTNPKTGPRSPRAIGTCQQAALSLRLRPQLHHLQVRQSAAEQDQHQSAATATEVQVDVTNTGSVAGDAVAQIYIHQRWGSASRPVRQLKGFRRVTAAARRDADAQIPAGQRRA